MIYEEVKPVNSDRQNNGPVVVKASKDKKKINQKVCAIIHFIFTQRNNEFRPIGMTFY